MTGGFPGSHIDALTTAAVWQARDKIPGRQTAVFIMENNTIQKEGP
jgi:hypothetical protein